MLKMPETQGKFFSVSQGIAIQGAKFHPAICYPLTPLLQPVVERMARDGTAKVYTERVRFVSGVAYPVKKPEAPAAVPQRSSVSLPGKAGDAIKQTAKKPLILPEKQRGRKSGRNAYTPQANREFD
jgi:hypothetical protein